jgi:hypothetical protein
MLGGNPTQHKLPCATVRTSSPEDQGSSPARAASTLSQASSDPFAGYHPGWQAADQRLSAGLTNSQGDGIGTGTSRRQPDGMAQAGSIDILHISDGSEQSFTDLPSSEAAMDRQEAEGVGAAPGPAGTAASVQAAVPVRSDDLDSPPSDGDDMTTYSATCSASGSGCAARPLRAADRLRC